MMLGNFWLIPFDSLFWWTHVKYGFTTHNLKKKAPLPWLVCRKTNTYPIVLAWEEQDQSSLVDWLQQEYKHRPVPLLHPAE